MLASLTSAALLGLTAEPVPAEVNTAEEGEPRLVLVGLPDTAVRESCDRVFSALSNGGHSAGVRRDKSRVIGAGSAVPCSTG